MLPKIRTLTLLVIMPILLTVEIRETSAQTTLAVNTSVDGQIVNAGDQAVWQFFALTNDVFSVRVEAEGDFDPILTILDPNDDAILVTDDYNYPDTRDALAEAITTPRTGNYTVIVTGYAGSTGAFTLSLLPGYADVAFAADFSEIGDWVRSGDLTVDADGEQVFLELNGIQTRGILVQPDAGPFDDFYMQMDVATVGGRNGWRVGVVLRWQSNGNHTVVEIGSEGAWRLVTVAGEQVNVIRDWTTHPAIAPGETRFQLGVLAIGDGFEVFYNRQLVGQVVNDSPASGRVGISLLTVDAFNSSTVVTVDDLLITTPTQVDDAPVFPDQLVVGNANQTVHELERRRLIPMGGNQPMSVTESFIERRSDGVDTLALGRGATYSTFALSTTIEVELFDSGVVACGLMLRNTGDEAYTVAFVDNFGGYGVSDRAGNAFTNSFYDENAAWAGTTGHNLLVVVNEGRVDYFINGRYVGSADLQLVEGEVGNVAMNYSPINSLCRFEDTWLWRWE